MAQYDGLLEAIPVADIARQLGIDEDVAAQAVQQAIPAILGGMNANVQDGGAASLEKALAAHSGGVPTSLAAVDTADGEKIVKNVFGTNTTKVQEAVAVAAPSSNVTQDLIAKLLPILAPIVISWLASQFLNKKSEPAAAEAAPASSGGGIGDLLGGLLGGGGGSSSGGGVGDLLGGLLGGGGSSSGGGSGDLLGGILGGLLGGGKR